MTPETPAITEVTAISLRVHEVRQNTSYEHVVVFNADLLLLPDDPAIDVKLLSIQRCYPPKPAPPKEDSELRDCEYFLQFIREGIEAVLVPRGLGALVEVSDMAVHLTDSKDHHFVSDTIKHLESALASLTTRDEDDSGNAIAYAQQEQNAT